MFPLSHSGSVNKDTLYRQTQDQLESNSLLLDIKRNNGFLNKSERGINQYG